MLYKQLKPREYLLTFEKSSDEDSGASEASEEDESNDEKNDQRFSYICHGGRKLDFL